MNIKKIKLVFLILFVFSIVGKTNPKPNIIFFLADDLGWKDTGCYGSDFFETPNIDKLASQGVMFMNAYSAHPVCGPTRASILSGKTPVRLKNVGVAGNLKGEELTWAEVLKSEGYATFFAGKWHQGMKKGIRPIDQGFDTMVGVNHAGSPGSYFYPFKDKGISFGHKRVLLPNRNIPNFEDGKNGDYLTERLTDRTLEFIEQNKAKPFVVYLSHYAVHTPLEAKESDINYFKEKNDDLGRSDSAVFKRGKNDEYISQVQSNPVYAGMIKKLDDSLGRIMKKLDELHIAENTILIFTSDNGGFSCLDRAEELIPTSNLPLRAGKGWIYEGGIRIPLVVKVPGKNNSVGSCDIPVVSYDMYPTILELVGVDLKPEQHKDGMSMANLVTGKIKEMDKKNLEKRTLIWNYPYRHSSGHKPSAAIRKDNLKLIKFIETNQVELYNLKEDPVEEINLADRISYNKVKEQLLIELDSLAFEKNN